MKRITTRHAAAGSNLSPLSHRPLTVSHHLLIPRLRTAPAQAGVRRAPGLQADPSWTQMAAYAGVAQATTVATAPRYQLTQHSEAWHSSAACACRTERALRVRPRCPPSCSLHCRPSRLAPASAPATKDERHQASSVSCLPFPCGFGPARQRRVRSPRRRCLPCRWNRSRYGRDQCRPLREADASAWWDRWCCRFSSGAAHGRCGSSVRYKKPACHRTSSNRHGTVPA